jgi:hypothetical protein
MFPFILVLLLMCIFLQVEEKSSSWHTLQQDASQAQEQNELLTNELQLQKEKLEQIQAEYDERGGCMFVTNIGSFSAHSFPVRISRYPTSYQNFTSSLRLTRHLPGILSKEVKLLKLSLN